jgi:hypothetical protein
MASLAEYFAENRYKGKWEIGDRVFGHWNKIPFIGSVGSDSVISELDGPRVTITLDLPIRINNHNHYVVIVKPKDLKRLTEFTDK